MAIKHATTRADGPRDAVSRADFIHTDVWVWVSMAEAKQVWAERIELLMPVRST
jgi:ornithine carbamoyltransferase